MAMWMYSHVDGRKSSYNCSTIAIAVFVAFCLVGVWMLMSSSDASIWNLELQPQELKSKPIQKITENGSTQFQENAASNDGNRKVEYMKTNSGDGDSGSKTEVTKTEVENGGDGSTQFQENASNNGEYREAEYRKTGSGNEDSGSKAEVTKTETKIGGDGADSIARLQPEQTLVGHNEAVGGPNQEDKVDSDREEEKTEKNQDMNNRQNIGENSTQSLEKNKVSDEVSGAQSEILKETTTQIGTWSTQAVESRIDKQSQNSSLSTDNNFFGWKLCNVTAGADYIPCLDNLRALKKLRSTKHYEHRERHCPNEAPTCLVALPEGYKTPIKWPKSREKIWYYNVPHTKLVEIKGGQNWTKVSGQYITFPGGGTQFTHGALHYIDFIQASLPDIAWGKRSRVLLDVGCGVASFGGYLFDRDVLAMSFAPKDEHEAQVQFALERGIPAILAVMGTKRLPFPSRVFDVIHCARCRVPWHIEGGKLLLELNRVLRPGGYFVWSATPVYRKGAEDAGIWKAMSRLTKSMCWDLEVIKMDKLNRKSAAFYRKPTSNECYERRTQNEPPLCQNSDDPNAAWNVTLQACMHKVPVDASEQGSQWPENWPLRLERVPYWFKSTQTGVYGKVAPEDFAADYEHWKHVVSQSYLNGLGISWSSVRNVMDMNAVYGGFAAALRDMEVWVMNVVPISSPDTLPIIYERGLFGIYHDWCQSFSTYPRSYDLIHADHLFSNLKKSCELVGVIAEVDRILRPGGKLIVRDKIATISEVEDMARSLHWEIRLTYSKDNEGLLSVQKTMWRPTETENVISNIV